MMVGGAFVYAVFDTNFSNQEVQMKIKETEIWNINIHAHVYINLFLGEVKACIL